MTFDLSFRYAGCRGTVIEALEYARANTLTAVLSSIAADSICIAATQFKTQRLHPRRLLAWRVVADGLNASVHFADLDLSRIEDVTTLYPASGWRRILSPTSR